MFRTVVLEMNNSPPPVRSSEMPRAAPPKLPSIRQSSMKTAPPVMMAPPVMRIPIRPVLTPLRLRLRRRTVFRTSVAAKLSKGMLMPFVPALRIEANTSWQSMVIDLVIVTVPKPPGSRQLISPLSAVLEMAPAKVLHGAVRLQGLASSPTPDTQVREAWACAGAAASRRSEVAAIVSDNEVLRMMPSEVDVLGDQFMTVILRWL